MQQNSSYDCPALVLKNAAIVTPDGTAVSRSVVVRDGRIVATAPGADAFPVDLRGHLIFPGLINAHDHLHLNAIPSPPQEKTFPNSYAWIEAFQTVLDTPAVRAARMVPPGLRHWQGGLKNLLCGAATVMHHDPWNPVFEHPGFPVRVLRRCGWSHSLGLGQPVDKRSSIAYGPPVRESCAATSPDTPWFIHLAEGTDEIAASELAELDTLGCLRRNTVIIHGAGLSDADITRLLAQGAGVVWCPASNQSLLGRTLLNPCRLLNAGRLALGTDSRLTGGFDLLTELQAAAALSDLPAADLLRLVTGGGSRLLRLPEAGGLAPGQWADLLIARDSGTPPADSLLRLRRADIRAVFRGGMPAVADPDFADCFAACGIECVSILLDGLPKIMDARLLGPEGAACLEPGLEVPGKASRGKGAAHGTRAGAEDAAAAAAAA